MQKMNGKPAPPAADNPHELPPNVTPEQLAAAARAQMAINDGVSKVVGTMIRGLMVSFPGVPEHIICQVVAHHTAFTLASIWSGDLGSVLGIRKDLKAAFDEGMHKAPLGATPADISNLPPPPGSAA